MKVFIFIVGLLCIGKDILGFGGFFILFWFFNVFIILFKVFWVGCICNFCWSFFIFCRVVLLLDFLFVFFGKLIFFFEFILFIGIFAFSEWKFWFWILGYLLLFDEVDGKEIIDLFLLEFCCGNCFFFFNLVLLYLEFCIILEVIFGLVS